ncbi:MAG: diacylglycerol kinase family protein [Candidatus Omnitrophica bacterium]|nr:diacylglycerol kinase family protein [Candidatus Omnitrophota bacterium]
MPTDQLTRASVFQENPSDALSVGIPRCRTRRHALRCALRGLREAWESQPNFRFHLGAGAAVAVLGGFTRLILVEWLWVSVAIGLVVFAELMNTAIEQTVDLTVGLRADPLARQVKDIAAGCVLVAAVIAALIGTLTFAPHLLRG